MPIHGRMLAVLCSTISMGKILMVRCCLYLSVFLSKLFQFGTIFLGATIPLTMPAGVFWSHRGVMMCFFTGIEHQANPPSPDFEDNVFLGRFKELDIYTR